MLHSVNGNPVTFVHGAINGEHHALREEVEAPILKKSAATAHFRYSAPSPEDEQDHHHHSSGLFDQAFLSDFITPETEIYFCGPKPMMQHIYQVLRALDHPAEQTYYEFFGPQEDLEGHSNPGELRGKLPTRL
jgi:nitric oxide dioxygenase